MGFINPAADVIGGGSRYTTCFHDITTGNNTSSGSPSKFYAVAGYDLCTGWGTPAGQNLINALATPDSLLVILAGLAFSGGVGGPFSPSPGWLTLTNSGTNALSWTLVNTSSWFNVSPTSGILQPGGLAASVSVSVDASANTLAAGLYSAVLAVTNLTSGMAQSCSLALSVAAPGMSDSFDPGLDLSQWSSFRGVVGSTVLATNYGGSVSAPNSLWFGDGHSRFATTVPINTSGGGEIGFCIRLADGSGWPWTRVDNLPAEGVVLECSTNGGGSWTSIGSYDSPVYYNWTGVVLPVPLAAQGPATLFRWRQLSSSGANYDHWALDNVIIGTGLMAPKIVMDPQSQTVATGDAASLTVAAVGTQPLSYQWLLNGTNLNGATTSALAWTSVQLTDAGTYSVLVSNSVGSAMSTNAVLTVYVPVCAPPSAGLVSWWAAEGDASDVLGANNGVLEGGVSFVKGKVGSAFNFDGSSGYIDIPASASLNVGAGAGLTFECWIKPASATANEPVAEWNSGAHAAVHLWLSQPTAYSGGGAGSIYANLVDTTGAFHTLTSSGGILSANGFQHVALTYDKASGAARLYYNGTLVASQSLGSFTPQTGVDLYLGKRVSDAPYTVFQGSMDEASVYSRALSASEIQAIYYASSAGKCFQPTAPSIVVQPQSQTVNVGAAVGLSVAATGTQPLSYQWLLDGTNLNGATANSLAWSQVQLTDAGTYSVLVSNRVGSAISSNAVLAVHVPVCAPPPSNLVAWWEGEGNAIDNVGTNNGALYGGMSFGAGEVGQAFNFDGSSGYVNIPASASLNIGAGGGLTIECWINPASATANQALVEWNSGVQLGVHLWISQPTAYYGGGPGSIYVNLFDTAGSSHTLTTGGGILNTNGFQHVALTYDKASGATCLYYNGELMASQSLGTFTPQTSLGLYLGERPTVASSLYRGLMDEVSLYNRALGAAEIQAIYGATSAGKCTQPAAPSIVAQPQSQTVNAGATVNLSVASTGTQPLSYQWSFNGAPLSGATRSLLSLPNAQPSDAGTYAVVVTNVYGSITSSNASLTVTILVCVPTPSNLVGWWPGQGDASDATGTNSGVAYGNLAFAGGEIGSAFNFDGSSAYVRIPASASVNVGASGGLTIEGWIKPASATANQALVEWNSGVQLGVHLWISQPPPYGGGSGSIYVNLIDTTGIEHRLTTGGGILNSTGFQHVALTYDKASGATCLYYNGGLVASQSLGTFTPQTSSDLYLGERPGTASSLFHGLMDEVSLYNRALGAAEIQAIYGAVGAGKCGSGPFIAAQPQSQTVTAGQPATFSVTAGGTQPLSYQWRASSNNIPGATGRSLVLTNVQLTDAGAYSVTVSNALGSATSAGATLTVVLPPPCAPPASNLVAWWAAEGNAKDNLGTNNGVLHGGMGFVAGEVGQAFNFDGSSGYVTIPASATLNAGAGAGLTFECWINPTSATANQALAEWNTGLGQLGVHLWISQPPPFGGGAGSIYVNMVDTAGSFHPLTTAGGVLSTTGFQHLALTYDKATGATCLYYNGALMASQSLGSFTPQTSRDLYLGERPTDSSSLYRGLMDEVSLYNRALGAAEIQAVFSAGHAGKCELAPSIQTPPSSRTVECSSNVTFAVTAAGQPPLAYRWWFGTDSIPGATNALLTLTNVGFAQAGNYSVVVTNAYGSATGGPALLTVVDTTPPTILSCAPNRTLSAGGNCNASLPDLTGEVVASDASGPVTVTQSPLPGTLLGLGLTNVAFTVRDSSGNTSFCASSLTVADTTPPFVQACVLELTLDFDTNCQALLPDLTSTNYIVASDNCSSVSVTQTPPAHTVLPAGTNTVLLTVSDSAGNQTTRAVAVIVPGELRIAVQPANVSAVLSSNTTFNVIACGAAPLLYQWQHFSTNLPGATNLLLALSNLTTNDAGEYRVVITNAAGSITSAVAALTVLQPPVITRQPRNAVAAPGATVSFSVTVKGLSPLAYQWQVNGAPLAGQTKASLTVSNVQWADYAGYAVGITNADGGLLSAVAMLTLAASPMINSLDFNSSTFLLAVPTEVGPTYVVEYKNDLEDPGWTVLTTVAGTGFSIPISDNGLTNAARFYRVRVR